MTIVLPRLSGPDPESWEYRVNIIFVNNVYIDSGSGAGMTAGIESGPTRPAQAGMTNVPEAGLTIVLPRHSGPDPESIDNRARMAIIWIFNRSVSVIPFNHVLPCFLIQYGLFDIDLNIV